MTYSLKSSTSGWGNSGGWASPYGGITSGGNNAGFNNNSGGTSGNSSSGNLSTGFGNNPTGGMMDVFSKLGDLREQQANNDQARFQADTNFQSGVYQNFDTQAAQRTEGIDTRARQQSSDLSSQRAQVQSGLNKDEAGYNAGLTKDIGNNAAKNTMAVNTNQINASQAASNLSKNQDLQRAFSQLPRRAE
jgi:hypothetical protein